MKNVLLLCLLAVAIGASAATDIVPNPASPGNLGSPTNAFPAIYGTNLYGNGSGLTSLNGANLQSGTVNSNALDGATMALLGASFDVTKSNAYNGTVTGSIISTNISGNGGGLTNVPNVWPGVLGQDTNAIYFTGLGVVSTFASGDSVDMSALNGVPWQWSGAAYTNGEFGCSSNMAGFESTFVITNAAHPDDDFVNGNVVIYSDVSFPVKASDFGVGWQDNNGSLNVTTYYGTNATPSSPLISSGAYDGVHTPGIVVGNSNTAFSGTFSGSLVGTFAGDLSGGTNFPTHFLTPTNFDNATLANYLAGNFMAFSNWNRFGTSNTFYALRNQKQVTLLVDGTGLTSEPGGNLYFDSVFYSLTNYIPLAGYITPAGGINSDMSSYGPLQSAKTSGNTGFANQNGSTGDDWWFGYSTYLTNSGAGITFNLANNFPADTFEIDWRSWSGGAAMSFYTNGVLMVSKTGVSSSPAGNVFRWTNTAPAAMTIGITNTAAGINQLVGLVWINSKITNGLVIGFQSGQGTSIGAMVTPTAAVKAPIYKSWNPTLILFNSVSPASDYAANFQQLTDFYKTNTPNSDVVICGTHGLPLSYSTPICTESDNIANISTMRADAMTNGYVFYDGHGPMADNSEMHARGLANNFDPHLTNAGYEFYNSLLWSFLGLTERH